MWVQSLNGEDPLEEGMATYSSILAWRIPMERGTWLAAVHGVAKSHMYMAAVMQNKRTYKKEIIHYLQENTDIICVSYQSKIPTIKPYT